MKREIKFRVWDRLNEQMIYPLPISNNTSGDLLNRWDDENLMQFTGLKDKNGREIYADDVISDGELRYRVYAMYGGFGIKSPYWSKDMNELSIGDDLIIQPLADAQTMSYIAQSCEVIGNIYENPELLN